VPRAEWPYMNALSPRHAPWRYERPLPTTPHASPDNRDQRVDATRRRSSAPRQSEESRIARVHLPWFGGTGAQHVVDSTIDRFRRHYASWMCRLDLGPYIAILEELLRLMSANSPDGILCPSRTAGIDLENPTPHPTFLSPFSLPPPDEVILFHRLVDLTLRSPCPGPGGGVSSV